jgi:uncharacterized protein (DUF2062 family)
MFRRRTPLSLWQQFRAFIWPKRGFSRLVSYLVQRIMRMPGSPYSIACGVACGAAISFTPFIGLHVILACAICVALGGNVIAALIGSAIGNPLTFPVFLVGASKIGNLLLANLGFDIPLQFGGTLAKSSDSLALFIPISVGGSVIAILVWPFFFGITYYTVIRWRALRQKRRLTKPRDKKQTFEKRSNSHD